MKTFKFFWNTHKWAGIIAALIIANISITGFLLLIKKQSDWIQPPTMKGQAGEISDFITNQQMFEALFGAGHPDFRTLDDIERVDFRPDKRVFKVRSNHNWSEIQIDAMTGEVLSIDIRRSDFIEQLHDGQLIAGWFHGWIMPAVAVTLLFLVFSGLWMWIEPMVKRKKRRESGKRRAQASAARKEGTAGTN